MSDDAFTQTTRILRVLLDEYKAPPMALVALANVRKIEAGWQELRARIATLESERDALRAQVSAASDRYDRAVADADEVRGRLVAERDAARGNAETQRLIRRSVEKQLTAVRDEGMRNYDHAIEQRDAALADVARLKAERDEARGKALEEAADEVDRIQWGPDGDCGAPARIRALAAPATKGGANG